MEREKNTWCQLRRLTEINYINLYVPFVIDTMSGLSSVRKKIPAKRLSGSCQVMLMTSEEIKAIYSMRDILTKCGLPAPNRAGFCHCPFHKGDREPSMKIYDKDFHCFACGANGDIFDFVSRFYDISFKDAFRMLGGDYKKNDSFASNLAIYRAKKESAMKRKKAERECQRRKLIYDLIGIYREYMNRAEPLSDAWCDCYNAMQMMIYRADINMLGMVPEKYIQIMGIQKLGICEFFCLLFILYEAVSILKNMTLCGLPVPARIKKWIQKFLEDMTEELPEDAESK